VGYISNISKLCRIFCFLSDRAFKRLRHLGLPRDKNKYIGFTKFLDHKLNIQLRERIIHGMKPHQIPGSLRRSLFGAGDMFFKGKNAKHKKNMGVGIGIKTLIGF